MIEAGSKVLVHFYSNNKEINTRKTGIVFDVFKQDDKLGINWNTEKSPYTCKGNIFTPFYTFANSVIFEDIETGRCYYYSDLNNGLVEKEG